MITVQTPSGSEIAGNELSPASTVNEAKDILAKRLGYSPSQLKLLHGNIILENTSVLADVCEESAPDTRLTLVVVPTITGIFTFRTKNCFEGGQPAGRNTSASVVAIFKNGNADILVSEHEITSLCSFDDDDKDPYGDIGDWLARYVGTIGYMADDAFSIDVTLCQRRGVYASEQAAEPSMIDGKRCSDNSISLEIVFAAGGCNDFHLSAAGLKWITLCEEDEVPKSYARNIEEVAEIWAPKPKVAYVSGGANVVAADVAADAAVEPKSRNCSVS